MDKKQLTERGIFTKFILPAIKKSGWGIRSQIHEKVTLIAGRVIVRGQMGVRSKRADFILYHKPNIPLAIAAGMQQALSYADLLEVPFIFSFNGNGFIFQDKTGLSPQIEQKRIVAKVDQLEKQLTQSYSDAEKLMQSTVKSLVA